MIRRLPRIFGHEVRTRYLVGVAMRGPTAARAVARELAIDPARLPSLFRLFQNCGVLCRDADKRLVVDTTFPAYAELMVLLRALGGERVIVFHEVSNVEPNWPRSSRLFGTRARTRVLIALSALDAASISDVAFAASVRPATARHIVRSLEQEGLLTGQFINNERVIRLAEDLQFSALLRALLLRMIPSVAGLSSRAAMITSRIFEGTDRKQFQEGDHAPLPFGTDAQGRVLGAIVQRPLRTSDIASATALSHYTVRQVIDVLERHDLVATTVIGKGAGGARWVALNANHPLTRPLSAYVRKSQRSGDTNQRALPPKNLKVSRRVRERNLPGSRELKTLVITTIQDIGEAEVSEIARSLGRSDHGRVRRCVERLADAKLIEYGILGGRMRARLPQTATNAAELEALVAATRAYLD